MLLLLVGSGDDLIILLGVRRVTNLKKLLSLTPIITKEIGL